MDQRTCTVFITAQDGEDIELSVTYEAYYQSAKLSGPPEECYPADGELNVLSFSPDMPLSSEQQAYIEEQCWEHYMESDDDF